MKKYNQYFNIFKTTLEYPRELISTIRVGCKTKIWDKILETYLNTPEYTKLSYDDPYGSIYNLNIKLYIKELFPEVYDLIKGLTLHDNKINLDDDCFSVCLGTLSDYKKVDKLSFIKYINSEVAENDQYCYITDDILINAGFEYMEQESKLCEEYQKTTYGITDYKSYRKWTDDKHPIKLDIDNGWNNRGAKWSLHIDNDACETIGCADIDYTWQFNKLMEVFDSKFRLYI